MDYVDIADARDLPGLRLALTGGLPGPWSQAAKYLFEVKKIPYTPVRQSGAGGNEELYAWTGHRNAPVAVFDEEPPRTGWHEILVLAERLGSADAPVLLPPTSADRVAVLGIIAELGSEGGLAWQRRMHLIATLYATAEAGGDARTRKAADVLAGRYGYTEQAPSGAGARVADILGMLSARLRAQRTAGSDYFVGEGFTAADLYWACFSQFLAPMPEPQNPMPDQRRQLYQTTDPDILAALDPALLAHRDRVYQRHLSLPLDF
jgi:glutathione S-transferase